MASIFNFIKKYAEFIILLLFALIGFFTAGQYGFAWDEYAQREIGEVNIKYILNKDNYLFEYGARDHGAIFEMFLIAIEKLTGVSIEKDIYTQRHFVTHLFFLLSAYYFFKLILLLYKEKTIAIIGLLFLILNPTIYGHSFFNSKDLPFLSMLIICFYQFALAFRDKKYFQFILLCIFTSILINIRIMGILFLFFTLFFLTFDAFVLRKEKHLLKKNLLLSILFFTTTIVFVIIGWPLLWKNPIDNFTFAFNNLSQYPWNGENLFKGELISAKNLKWNYIPTWFSINTPIIYFFMGLLGILLVVITFFKNLKEQNLKNINKNNALYLMSLFAPIVIVVVLHSVLYDGWRHLFYIYPPFVMLSIYFIWYFSKTKYKKLVYVAAMLGILNISIFIATNFPYHHVYFNQFVSLHEGEYLRKNYDMDFWAVSYNKSLEYILKHDSREQIIINSENHLADANSHMLELNEKKRLIFTDTLNQADYFITNYRFHPNDFTSEKLEEFHSVYVLGSKINTIYKVKK